MAGASCDLRGAQARLAVRDYTSLHEGMPPEKLVCQPLEEPEGKLVWVGRLTEIQYLKKVKENGVKHAPAYHHPFADWAQPDLYVDGRGKLFVRGRHYYTTERGIEDWRTPTARAISSAPKRLVTLGKLEWIRYNDGQRFRKQRFGGPGQPEVAHDELGKLHVLGGRYQLEGVDPMAKRRRRRSAPRANPSAAASRSRSSGMSMDKAGELAVQGLVLSAVAVAAGKGMSYIPKLDTLHPVVRGLAEIAIGMAAGIGAEAAGLPTAVSGGLVVAGTVPGLGRMVDAGIAKAQELMAPDQPATTPPAGGGTNPAGQLMGGTRRGMYVGQGRYAHA